jgi:hypothetical protein
MLNSNRLAYKINDGVIGPVAFKTKRPVLNLQSEPENLLQRKEDYKKIELSPPPHLPHNPLTANHQATSTAAAAAILHHSSSSTDCIKGCVCLYSSTCI